MKKTLLALIILSSFFSVAPQASALDVKSITAKPTADNPQYGDKKVWPTLVGDEYFQKTKWEKKRLLIWNINGSAKNIPGRQPLLLTVSHIGSDSH